MGLRPFWKQHRFLLRFAGVAIIVFSPLLILICIACLAWDEREDIALMYKDAWEYITGKEVD